MPEEGSPEENFPEQRRTGEARNWPRESEELAACFTVHARDLFGYACMLADADRPLAGDLVQATFEAAASVWCTLRDRPAGQCREWLRERLATEAQQQTGHPPGRMFVSPSHRRLTELKMARYGADYDAVAALDRFAGWLRSQGRSGDEAPRPGARKSGRPQIRPACPPAINGSHANGSHANGAPGNGGSGSPSVTGASGPPGSYGDPVRALYEQHYASLVRLAALLVDDTATAEKIVQDAFVAACRRGGTLDRPLAFLRQSVLDRSRSARFRAAPPGPAPTGMAPTGPAPTGPAPTGPAPRNGSTPAPAANSPAGPALLTALGTLPARQREVLVMRYYANLSEEQAADAIGISRAAVRRHATRANAALRTVLDAG